MDKVSYIPSNESILDISSKVYTTLRLSFSKIDNEMAFIIDRFRRTRIKMQNVKRLENDLEEKLDSIKNISQTLPPKERGQLQDKQSQIQWMLKEIRR